MLAVFDGVEWVYGSRWETLQQTQADEKIKAAEKRASDAEEAVKNLPKPIVLTPLVRANFKLSDRWGDAASVSHVNGDARAFAFTVTARGKGVGMRPSV